MSSVRGVVDREHGVPAFTVGEDRDRELEFVSAGGVVAHRERLAECPFEVVCGCGRVAAAPGNDCEQGHRAVAHDVGCAEVAETQGFLTAGDGAGRIDVEVRESDGVVSRERLLGPPNACTRRSESSATVTARGASPAAAR